MTKVEKKLKKNQKRLAVLNNRYEKLIELNSIRNYVSMILTEKGLVTNPKADQYLRLLLAIKQEKQAIWNKNRELNQKYADSLEVAKQANVNYLKSITLTKHDLFNLTAPDQCLQPSN